MRQERTRYQEIADCVLHLIYLLLRPTSNAVHPKRAHIHEHTRLGDKLSDLITGELGSWPFIGLHAIWFAVWLLLRLDINLLTLIVSLEAIFLSAFVMMSQNRSGAKDRLRDDTEASEVEQLYQINQQQLEILRLLNGDKGDARE